MNILKKVREGRLVEKEDEVLTQEQLRELIPGLRETDEAIEDLMVYANTTETVSEILTLMERREKLVARHQVKKEPPRPESVVVERKGLDWTMITCELIKGGCAIVGGVAVMTLVGVINSQGFTDHKAIQTAANLFRR